MVTVRALPVVQFWVKSVLGREDSMRQEQRNTDVAGVWVREMLGGERTDKAQSLVWFDMLSV